MGAGLQGYVPAGNQGLGFTMPSLPAIDFSNWQVIAGLAAVALVVYMLLRKRSARGRRADLLKARLKYTEDEARIRRQGL